MFNNSAVSQGQGGETDGFSATPVLGHAEARVLIEQLHRAYSEAEPIDNLQDQDDAQKGEATAKDQSPGGSHAGIRPVLRKLFKVALAVLVVALLGWQPVQALLTPSSVQAVVNARIITLRAPIDGEIAFDTTVTPGMSLQEGRSVARILNRRADDARVSELQQRISELKEQDVFLKGKLNVLLGEISSAEGELEEFRIARIKQMQARRKEIDAEINSAIATHRYTTAALERLRRLVSKGVSSQVQLELAQRDEALAHEAIAAANKRLDYISVELEALHSGHFVGDGYNDNPRTRQRLQELRQSADVLRAEISHNRLQRRRLARDLKEAENKYSRKAQAVLKMPASASVWEVLTTPGEHIREGQELIRFLDCSAPVVSANVTENVYNRLFVGAPARLRLNGSARDLEGRVVQMTGYAATPSNFAIAPSALEKEPYRVTLAVDGLAQGQQCWVGKTGRLTFDVPQTAIPSRLSAFANRKILGLGVGRDPG